MNDNSLNSQRNVSREQSFAITLFHTSLVCASSDLLVNIIMLLYIWDEPISFPINHCLSKFDADATINVVLTDHLLWYIVYLLICPLRKLTTTRHNFSPQTHHFSMLL